VQSCSDDFMIQFMKRNEETVTSERFGEGIEMSDEITQQGLLPGVK